jgi:predicted nucleic acid-binding protein
MKAICVDTGFLIGLYDDTDSFHAKAKKYFSDFFDTGSNHLLIPWPVLYEAISTRMVKNKKGMTHLQGDWKRFSIERRLDLLSDLPYREGTIDECFYELGKPLPQCRNLSAADRVIRNMLSDKNLRIHAFVTFNPKDFNDVCATFGCEMHS